MVVQGVKASFVHVVLENPCAFCLFINHLNTVIDNLGGGIGVAIAANLSQNDVLNIEERPAFSNPDDDVPVPSSSSF